VTLVSNLTSQIFTSFDGNRRIASGPLAHVAVHTKRALDGGAVGPVLLFDDSTGRSIDIDMRGSEAEMASRFRFGLGAVSTADPLLDAVEGDTPRGRGRPKLGVVSREVTLLPRHWDWLAAQTGGASVVLRKLVDSARREEGGRESPKKMHERAYHFMSAIGGNLPGFEEASRALFANDQLKLEILTSAWPEDVREHIFRLGFVK
jgi:hypothetical protein